MKGFTKIESPEDLKPGDVLLLPPGNRALHVTTSTLSRHGLSSGDTCRSTNDARLVAKVFSDTAETGAALMVSYTDVRTTEPLAHTTRGLNTLEAYALPKKRICFVHAHLLDGDMLPTASDEDDPDKVLRSIAPLVDAVCDKFKKIAPPKAYSPLETEEWHLRGNPHLRRWKALKCVLRHPFACGPGPVMPLIPAQPQSERASLETEALARRLFCNGSEYSSHYTNSRDNTLVLNGRIMLHLISNGMEIHRPDPDTWDLLAEKVLERHSKAALKGIRQTEESIAAFMEAMRSDLKEFNTMTRWWKNHAAKFAARKSWIRSPYKQERPENE